MKKLLPFLLSLFVFMGCSTSKVVQNYEIEKQNETTKKDIKNNTFVSSGYLFTNSSEFKDIDTLAILFPSYTIGKYALEATNSINTYLINKNKDFNLKVYDIVTQNKKNITTAFEKIQDANITKVIAMITKDELSSFLNIRNIKNIKIYLPLINKYDVKDISKYENLDITFGAISYKDQFEKLISYSNNKKLVEFYDNSGIGRTLHNYLKNDGILYAKQIDDNNGRYKNFLKDNIKLDDSVILLNTPIVKSSILLSTLNAEEVNISSILSTQLNYTPLLFSLTQNHDRTKLVVANSIGNIPSQLAEYNKLIGNNLNYSWVNYSTIIGVEYLLNNNIDIFSDLKIKDNQIIFPVKLYKVGSSSFKLLK